MECMRLLRGMMEWVRHVILGGFTWYKMLTGDSLFDSRAAHAHPRQLSGVREQAGHARARAKRLMI